MKKFKRMVLGLFFVLLVVSNAMGASAVTDTVTNNKIIPVMLVDTDLQKVGLKIIDNKQRVVSESYRENIAKGAVANHVAVNLIGHTDATKLNVLVDLSALSTDIIPVPVAMPSVPVVAVAMEVVSTDVDDFATGTGANSVYISGLDLNGDVLTETLTLDATTGTTPVATANSYSRINYFVVVTAGSTGTAEGTISLRHVADTPVYSAIPPLFNESQQAHYTVPADQTFTLTSFTAGATGKESFVYLQATVNPTNGYTLTPGIYHTIKIQNMIGSTNQEVFTMPIVFPALTDIKITSESTNAAGGTASGTIEGYYEPAP